LRLAGIHHVAVVTRDLGRFVAFYADVFGVAAPEDPGHRPLLLDVGEVGLGAAVCAHALRAPVNPRVDRYDMDRGLSLSPKPPADCRWAAVGTTPSLLHTF
jgi:catechol 2,3-dioxygenase-like lactoylglutathione lyase family enzyme